MPHLTLPPPDALPTRLAPGAKPSGHGGSMPAQSDDAMASHGGGHEMGDESMPVRGLGVAAGGKPVAVEPYLGAAGHLVALREGGLALLHVHPSGHGDGDDVGPGPIGFAATFPTAGGCRLFLQFEVNRRVETVAFATEVE